jgi:hypothetical protein
VLGGGSQRMPVIKATVYDPPDPDFPYLGVVLIDGEVAISMDYKTAEAAATAVRDAVAGLTNLVNTAEAKKAAADADALSNTLTEVDVKPGTVGNAA